MFRGTMKAKEIFDKNTYRPILYIFDPDVDGLFSGYLMCKYLESKGLKYQYYINENRQHGFMLDLDRLEGYMVISADFSIYDEILEDMKSRDIVCINIDHHDIDGELRIWEKGVVINNQYDFEDEEKRYLSGAGVVFEVLKEWNENFNTDENMAIVGITLLSDIRPIESKDARAYLRKTYTQSTTEGYFRYLIENTIKANYGFGMPRMDRSYIDFTFSPRINSMLRFNESYEAVEFILGHGLTTSDKRDLQKNYVKYILENVRLKEYNHLVCATVERNTLNNFYEYLVENGLYTEDNMETMYYKQFLDSIEPSNFIGLACSKIKDRGGSTVISLKQGDTLLRGSFRGKCDGVDYLGVFRKNNSIAFGHKGAFGIHEIDLDDYSMYSIGDEIEELESQFVTQIKVLEVNNLSLFCLNKASNVAEKNCYVRDAYRTYIRYTGKNIKVTRKSNSYVEYIVDDNIVKCFDPELDISECLIMPLLVKGYVELYYCDVKL